MERGIQQRRRGEGDSVRLVGGVVAALLGVTLIVVALASMNPYSNATKAGSTSPASMSASVSSPPSEKTAASPAVAVAQVPAPVAAAAPVAAPSPTPAPAAAAKRKRAAAKKTLPAQMKRLIPGSRQIIVITGAKLGSNTGTLEVFNKKGSAWVSVLRTGVNLGKKGLVDGVKRKSGHMQTPTGIWRLGSFLFGLHSSATSGTTMPYRHITKNSWWSSERDATYNTWVDSKSHINGEHLIDADPQYEYAFNTGYNALPNQRVIGRGTAIFIHCFEPKSNSLGKFTHGCIAANRKVMIRLFKLLDPARHPSCAIGTLKKGSATSIWAY